MASSVAAVEPLCMWIVVRKDLIKSLSWSLGSVTAQACHASTAVLHQFKDDMNTIEYLKDTPNMHKVVLEIKNESQLKTLASKLTESSIDHYLWTEQPENIVTCLATKPYRKSDVGDSFKKCALFR
ncbi:peptidyl-tRNA hydrolase II domain-containing protein [Paraphysoderma sedebokerense]|nr:peptidyl-tRNA hydrolase II domain-containing protein [Paraphysoderma sedebokerense]KAI9142343.1 peptidyl-tRNA hydrolase II domain-containing protein [Paraphysoderma sedebokerense]